MAKTWRPQEDRPWRYSKADIITVDLVPLEVIQRALIGQLDREHGATLMAALDACNARFGRAAVVPGRTGFEKARAPWSTKFEMRTPRYTTRTDELPVALAHPATASCP